MQRGSSIFIIFGLFLLLAAGAVGVLMFASPAQSMFAGEVAQLPPTAEPMTPIVEAEIDIQEGIVITSTDGLLKMGEVPQSQFVAGVHLTSVEEARNMIATSTINAGEPVRTDTLRKAGLAQKIPAPAPGEAPVKAFPIQVNSLSGVADLVQAGDFVDVLASFNLDVVTFAPGAPTTGEERPLINVTEHATNEGTSKVLLQDVEVLDVIKPAPPAEGETAEETPPPAPEEDTQDGTAAPATPANTLNAGNWVIVVAVTNQEAEALRFALDRGIGITTVLRRAGDHTTERTVGATMRILVDNYGMPMPSFPQVVQQPAAARIEGVPVLPDVETPVFAPEIEAPQQ